MRDRPREKRLAGCRGSAVGSDAPPSLAISATLSQSARRRLIYEMVGAFARAAEEAPRKAELPSRESLNDWAVEDRLWRLLHKEGRQGPRGNDCMSWENPDGPAESARAPQ